MLNRIAEVKECDARGGDKNYWSR